MAGEARKERDRFAEMCVASERETESIIRRGEEILNEVKRQAAIRSIAQEEK